MQEFGFKLSTGGGCGREHKQVRNSAVQCVRQRLKRCQFGIDSAIFYGSNLLSRYSARGRQVGLAQSSLGCAHPNIVGQHILDPAPWPRWEVVPKRILQYRPRDFRWTLPRHLLAGLGPVVSHSEMVSRGHAMPKNGPHGHQSGSARSVSIPGPGSKSCAIATPPPLSQPRHVTSLVPEPHMMKHANAH
jgi:hypothetical protein